MKESSHGRRVGYHVDNDGQDFNVIGTKFDDVANLIMKLFLTNCWLDRD